MRGWQKIMSSVLGVTMAVTSFVGCGGDGENSSPDDSSMLPRSHSSSGDSNVDLNEKVLSLELWDNPSLDDRPMVMMHSIANRLIDDVYNRGYGGVVTNVAWDNTYLQNDRAFATLKAGVKYAIDKGMHIWLYDEYGYPSGSAYGLTLKNNPEYEALGLVPMPVVIGAGKTETVNLLYGHKEIVAAYIYDGSSIETINLASAQNVSSAISADKASVTYTNRTSSSKVLVAYMSKRWYEFTHSMENWYAQQRYINMLDAEPTSKFISVTHDKYYEMLQEYFGNGIQAFFTDEPALQGNYFDISDRNRQVIDTPDLNIPIVECLNYSESLFEKFNQAYGYDLKPYLGYLYTEDGSAKAKQVRMDFYALTSELFRNNYLGQIQDWCEDKGVGSSGHLLLEELLYQNTWFAGNMIQLLSTMSIPGTDLLYSEPLGAIDAACITSKFAAAAAEYTGKENTFAEISGAFDGTVGDIYAQINAVGAQICMGVNTYASYYYQGGNHTLEEDKVFSTALGRMRYMTTGVTHSAKTAVYYPYEGASAETLPTKNLWDAAAGAKTVSDSFSNLCRTLVGKQVDYDLVDHINLGKCVVKDGALVAPNGEEYTSIVIPYTTAIYSSTLLKLIEAANAGVEVVVVGVDEVVCETGKNAIAARWDELLDKAYYATTENGAANKLRQKGHTYVKLSDLYAENIFTSKRENANYSVFTFVNGYTNNKTYDIELYAEGNSVKYYNAVTGAVTDISARIENGVVKFNFTLPANTTGFFVVQK